MTELMRRRRALMAASGGSQVVDTSWIENKLYTFPKIAGLTVTGASNSTLGCLADGGGNPSHNVQICKSADQDNPVTTALVLPQVYGHFTIRNNKSIDMSYAYAYWTDTGAIIFAGKNSKWYGYANIDGTQAQPGWTGDRS